MAAEHETPSAAEVEEYLKGTKFPAKADTLRQRAIDNGVEEDPRAMEFFELITDKEYGSVTDVSKELHTYKEEQDMQDMDEAA